MSKGPKKNQAGIKDKIQDMFEKDHGL